MCYLYPILIVSSLPANRKNSPDTKSKTSVGYKTFSIVK